MGDGPLRRLPRMAAMGLTVILAALIALSALPTQPEGSAPKQSVSQGQAIGDDALYRLIAARVASGEDYYQAVAAEHRANSYPLKPFFTVRQPALAWAYALVGPKGLQIGLLALFIACAVALPKTLARTSGEGIGVLAMVLAVAVVAAGPGVMFHDLWAGVLLTLALALRRPDRIWPSLLCALAALLIRETALPAVLLWAGLALVTRRWRELGGVVAVLVIFAVALTLHANAVAAVTTAADPSSQGWSGFAGPALFVAGIRQSTALYFLPLWLAGPIVVLALFGFLARGSAAGIYAFVWLVGLAAMMALFARPENWYWATLGLPLTLAGLALVPRGLADLGSALRGRGETSMESA
ncbi:hypothetical protein [Croceicoccus sediminis]|uniref:hypothetical protein n=1 Tax=Croceicoccus sediminis TaxID=2571150 RepID=UPI0011844A40|nr:hypothetical protein [Croceicoccus sediminis]